MWKEGDFCYRLVVLGPPSTVRCPVSAWSCLRHVRKLSPFLHMCMLCRALRSWCSSCTAPDLSAEHPMWTSVGSVCVTELLPGRVSGSAVDRLRAGSCAGRPLDLVPTESDSLAQGRTRTLDTRPRCDLGSIRHEREAKRWGPRDSQGEDR